MRRFNLRPLRWPPRGSKLSERRITCGSFGRWSSRWACRRTRSTFLMPSARSATRLTMSVPVSFPRRKPKRCLHWPEIAHDCDGIERHRKGVEYARRSAIHSTSRELGSGAADRGGVDDGRSHPTGTADEKDPSSVRARAVSAHQTTGDRRIGDGIDHHPSDQTDCGIVRDGRVDESEIGSGIAANPAAIYRRVALRHDAIVDRDSRANVTMHTCIGKTSSVTDGHIAKCHRLGERHGKDTG